MFVRIANGSNAVERTSVGWCNWNGAGRAPSEMLGGEQ